MLLSSINCSVCHGHFQKVEKNLKTNWTGSVWYSIFCWSETTFTKKNYSRRFHVLICYVRVCDQHSFAHQNVLMIIHRKRLVRWIIRCTRTGNSLSKATSDGQIGNCDFILGLMIIICLQDKCDFSASNLATV